MPKRIVLFIITLLLLINNNIVVSKGLVIDKRRLIWSDFQGEVPDNSKFDAYTYWFIYYQFDAPKFRGSQVIINFRVWCELGKKSWVKRRNAKGKYGKELLNHEQGHYDLGRLCALELKKSFLKYNYSKRNYRKEIKAIYMKVFKKYLAIEKRYDKETKHMYHRINQKKWDKWIKNNLDKFSKYR